MFDNFSPCPCDLTGDFWDGRRFAPATVQRWEWAATLGRWWALVRFADGAEMYAYQKGF